MNPIFKQYTVAELYVPISKPNTLETGSENELPFVGFRPTGDPFFDAFLKNLYNHGIQNAKIHAQKLNMNYREMCMGVHIFTGKSYTDFVNEFILYLAIDLLKNKPPKTGLKSISERLGFGSYSGFYNFMIRHRRWQKKTYS